MIRKLASNFGIATGALLIPSVVFAQQLSTLDTIVRSIGTIVNQAIPIAAGLALLGFFFGLAKYIFQAGNDEAQDDAKDIMLWGVIALFLIAAIGGIIAALETTLGLGGSGSGNFDPTDYSI